MFSLGNYARQNLGWQDRQPGNIYLYVVKKQDIDKQLFYVRPTNV